MKNGFVQKNLVLFFIMLICLTAVIASTEKNDAKIQELGARYSHLECRLNLVKAQADNSAKYLSSAGLSEKKDKLDADFATLKGYADNGQSKEFNSFVTTTLKQDNKDIQDSVKDARKNLKNITKENRNSLKDAWKSSIDAFNACNSNAKKSIAGARLAFMNAQISDWNKVIDEMKAKGLDTSALEAVVADASQLTALLNEASNAETDDEFKSKADEARNLHLHLWARFHIAKVKAYLAKVEPKAVQAEMNDKVTEIKNLLNEASQLAQTGKKYGDGEFDKTWSDIRQASEKLKDLSKSLKEKTNPK